MLDVVDRHSEGYAMIIFHVDGRIPWLKRHYNIIDLTVVEASHVQTSLLVQADRSWPGGCEVDRAKQPLDDHGGSRRGQAVTCFHTLKTPTLINDHLMLLLFFWLLLNQLYTYWEDNISTTVWIEVIIGVHRFIIGVLRPPPRQKELLQVRRDSVYLWPCGPKCLDVTGFWTCTRGTSTSDPRQITNGLN